jgi:hypothetical protein
MSEMRPGPENGLYENDDGERYYTAEAVARTRGVQGRTVRRWAEKRKLPSGAPLGVIRLPRTERPNVFLRAEDVDRDIGTPGRRRSRTAPEGTDRQELERLRRENAALRDRVIELQGLIDVMTDTQRGLAEQVLKQNRLYGRSDVRTP